jgi:hypothetical protein
MTIWSCAGTDISVHLSGDEKTISQNAHPLRVTAQYAGRTQRSLETAAIPARVHHQRGYAESTRGSAGNDWIVLNRRATAH